MNMIYSVDPATEDLIFEHKITTSKQIEGLIKDAVKHQLDWQKRSLEERIEYVKAFQYLLSKNKQELATVISHETGKPLWESLQEIQAVISKVDISIEAFMEKTKSIVFEQSSKHYSIHFKPIGLLVVLGPFNFPAHLPHGHIIPAILAGNSVLFKPSELTSEIAKRMVSLWYEAGLPKHVLSLIVGGASEGEYLYKHPQINGVLFTGGYKTGQHISSYLGAYPEKLLALELGGNNPLVVSKTTYSSQLFDIIAESSFLTAGQRCTCARRLIVVDCKDKLSFEIELQKKVFSLKIGSFTDIEEPFMGPVIHQKSLDQIENKVNHLLNVKAREIVPFKKIGDTGFFCSPTILDVTGIKSIEDDECFGPLLQLIYVDSIQEAIDEANNTKYGLSASLISSDKHEQELFFSDVKAGIINFNGPTNGASSKLPFGGVGYSGNYRPSAYFAADYCSYPISSVKF